MELSKSQKDRVGNRKWQRAVSVVFCFDCSAETMGMVSSDQQALHCYDCGGENVTDALPPPDLTENDWEAIFQGECQDGQDTPQDE